MHNVSDHTNTFQTEQTPKKNRSKLSRLFSGGARNGRTASFTADSVSEPSFGNPKTNSGDMNMMSSVSYNEQPLDTVAKSTPLRPSETSTNNFHSTLGAESVSSVTAPPEKTLTPIYHRAREARRIQDWIFKGNAPILFLGDSNLNRIPPHTHKNIQIDSYPGAKFYHFIKVCEKSPVNPDTKIVVFSVGVNNRELDPIKTSNKQLRSLYRQAHITFPNAAIYVAAINFSLNLPEQQQTNLREINDHILQHLNYIPPLEHLQFHTQSDDIHWTAATASNMFAHWCLHLGL